jgi:hypothetical protein
MGIKEEMDSVASSLGRAMFIVTAAQVRKRFKKENLTEIANLLEQSAANIRKILSSLPADG